MPNEVRLQKMLSDCGVTSRRKAEEMIAAGKVQVNGRTAQIGDKVIPGKDRVTVDGFAVEPAKQKVYLIFDTKSPRALHLWL